jgi:hypothetical protein
MKKQMKKIKEKGDMMEEKALKYIKHVKMDKLPEFHYFLSFNSNRKN